MVKEWIQEYNPQNKEEAEAALREIMQEVALAGLQRTGFFEKAAFYGAQPCAFFIAWTDFLRIWIFHCSR